MPTTKCTGKALDFERGCGKCGKDLPWGMRQSGRPILLLRDVYAMNMRAREMLPARSVLLEERSESHFQVSKSRTDPTVKDIRILELSRRFMRPSAIDRKQTRPLPRTIRPLRTARGRNKRWRRRIWISAI